MQKLRITRRGKILIAVIALLLISGSVTAWQVCKYGSEEHGCSLDPRSWPGCIFGVFIDIGNCVMMFFISLMTEFILMNPDINEFKPFVNDIVSILFPIYVIAIIITGIYIIFLSTSPESRARAKLMLIRLIMGMAMVTTSLSIYELLLNLSEAIAGRILSGWILGGGGGGLAILATLVVVSVILFFISAWILPMLAVIALISIAVRFFLVSLMAVLFPLTLFLYFFEFTRSIGQNMMRYTLMVIFTQPVQALMLVIMIIGLNNISTTGDILGKIVSLVMGIAGFLMVIFAPLLMLKLMSWVGGAVAGAGMILAYKRPWVGALLVSAGGIGAGMGPEAMAAGGAVYTLGLAYQRKFPSRRRLDRTRRLMRKGWERVTGKVREKAPAVGAWLGRRRYIGRPLTIAHKLGKKYVGRPIGKTYGILKNVKRRAGHTVRVVRKHWKFIGKSLFIPGYWIYGGGKFMVRRTGISIRSRLRAHRLERHIKSIRRASTRSEVWNELRKSGVDERGVRQRWSDWWKRREKFRGREIRRLKEKYPIEKEDADKLQDELYREFKKLRGEKYMDTATAKNRARDLVNRYIAENDFRVVEEELREVGIDEKRITELGDRYDRRGLDRLKREAEESIKFKRAIEHDLDSATTFEEVEEINEGLGDRGLPKEELKRLKEREMERREKEVEKIEKEEAKDWARRKVAREGISSEDEAWAIEEMREKGINPEKLSSKELNEEIRARVIEREAHHEAERIINEEMVVSDKFTEDVKNSLRANDAMERLKYARNPEEVKAIAREFGVSERDIHRIGAEYMTPEEGIERKPSAIEKVKEKARKTERLMKAEKINREIDRAVSHEEIEEAIREMGLSRNDIDRMYAEDRNIPIHSARIKHDRNLDMLKESAKKAVRRKAMEKPVSIEEAKKMHERDLDTFKESAKKAIEEKKHQIENKLGILDKIRRYGPHIGLALTVPGYVPYMAGRSLYGAMTTARSLIALQMINRLNYQDAERYKKLREAMKRGGATEREARMLIGDERVVSKDDFEDLKKRASDFIIAKKFADRHYPGFTREFFKPFKPSSTIKKAIKRGKKYGVSESKLARIEKYYEREMARIEKKYAVPKGAKLSKERVRDLRKEKKQLIDRVNKQINNEIIESGGFSRHLRRVGDKYLLLDSEIRDIDNHFRISRAREISKLEKAEEGAMFKLRPEERIEKMNEINAKSLINTHRSVAEIVGVEGYNEMTTEEHADYAKLGLAPEGGEKGELLSEEEIKEESLKHSVDLGGNLHARMLLEDYMGIGPRPSEFYHGIGPETKEERERERERKEVSPLYTAATTETETLTEAVIEGLDELRKSKEEKSE